VAGTATPLGFSGMEAFATVAAAVAMGADPILAVRFSDADERSRHRGVSHHVTSVLRSLAALAVTERRLVRVGVPAGTFVPDLAADVVSVEVPDVGGLLAAAGIAVTTMGRSVVDDPGFFAWAGAAGALAAGDSLTRS
jgi:hypothetical protein